MEFKTIAPLFLFLAGLVLGWPILNLDRILAKYLSIPETMFHSFSTYILIFVLALFVITASSSVLGKGLVLSLMAHGALTLPDRNQKRLALGLLGLAVSLMIL
ncbi:MAG: hypothetical protein AAB506_02350 [Patescibacteria group bacterium]